MMLEGGNIVAKGWAIEAYIISFAMQDSAWAEHQGRAPGPSTRTEPAEGLGAAGEGRIGRWVRRWEVRRVEDFVVMSLASTTFQPRLGRAWGAREGGGFSPGRACAA